MSDALPLGDLLAQAPLPSADGDKTERGTLLIVGGPTTCPGAALLAGLAALRAGAGRVQLAVDPDVAAAVGVALPEALVLGWDHRGEVPPAVAVHLAAADAVLIGPGLDEHDAGAAVAAAHFVPADVPILLDAGALGGAEDLAGGERALVLAPNPVEVARLLGAEDPPEDEASMVDAGRRLAAELGRPIAVRGASAIVCAPDGAAWCERMLPDGLGTAGSGDVFAGVTGALLARGSDALAALGWAIAVHADAGRALEVSVAPAGYLAREVADQIPRSMHDLVREVRPVRSIRP